MTIVFLIRCGFKADGPRAPPGKDNWKGLTVMDLKRQPDHKGHKLYQFQLIHIGIVPVNP
jgi:hypothetical protein